MAFSMVRNGGGRIRLAKGKNADINTSSGNVVWHTLEGAKRAACKISDELGGWPVYYRKALLKGKPK